MIINNQDPEQAIKPSEVSKRRRRGAASASGTIVKNMPCPDCRAKGGDSSGNHLMVFEDGTGYCKRCPRKYTSEEVEQSANSTPRRRSRTQFQQSTYKPQLTIEDIQQMSSMEDKHRGITAATYEYFGIKTEINENNGRQIARYYPAKLNGEVYGYAKRTLPKKFEQDVGVTAGTDLFGWEKCTGAKRTLIIVEGQEDVAAGYQMWDAMNKRSSDRRYRRAAKHIIGIKGGSSCHKALMHHLESLTKYDKIIWMGDNYRTDKEGADALETAVRVLGTERVFIAEYPENKKDLGDVLASKEDDSDPIDIFAEMFFNAEIYSPVDIVDGANVTLDDIEEEPIIGLPSPFPSLDKKMGGLRMYEHTLVVSGSGMGKTSLMRALGHYINTEYNWKVGNIYLEEKNCKTQQGYIAYDNNVALNRYREDFSCIPYEDKQESVRNVINNMIFLNHNGKIDTEVLMDKIRYLKNMGCKAVIFDHISLATSGSDNERTDIDRLMEAMYRYCEHNEIHIFSIVHLNKGPSGMKDVTRGGEITPRHLLGSSGLMQMIWNLITVEGDNQHPKFKNRRYLRLLKTREGGDVGPCEGAYDYNPATGRFTYVHDADRSELDQDSDNMPKMGKYDNGAS